MATPEESPTISVRALQTPCEPRAILLIISGRIGPVDIAPLSERVRAWLASSDADLLVCDVHAVVAPDAVTVDALARVQLTARRLGREVTLRHVSRELRELLALMGLCDAVRLCDGSALETRRETEEREQASGVEEERDPGDLSA